ncbi:MAG: hypothetical protein ACFFDH_19660, partial [Promethearchaeota archaeon]
MSRKLEQVEHLRNVGKSEEALNIIKDLEKKTDLADDELLSIQLLKSNLLLDLRHLNEAKDLAETILVQSKKLRSYDKSIAALNIIAWVYRRLGKLEESSDIIEIAEDLIKTHFPRPSKEIQKKHATFFLIKG